MGRGPQKRAGFQELRKNLKETAISSHGAFWGRENMKRATDMSSHLGKDYFIIFVEKGEGFRVPPEPTEM